MKIVDVKTFVVGNPPPHFGGRYFVFLKLFTDGGVEGVGEVYCGHLSPARRRAHDRGRLRAPRHRRRSVPHRAPVAERLFERLHPAPRTLADGHPQRHRDGLLGHRRQGGRASRSTSCSAAGPRAAALLHYLYPRGRRPDRGLPRFPSWRQSGRRVRRAGLHAVKFDPVGPYSAFDPRSCRWTRSSSPSASSRRCARRWAAAAICCSAPTAR